LEVVAERFGFRDRIRAHPLLGWVYRILVAIVGGAVLVAGIIMIPAPGPGWFVVFIGLGILGTEFAWARRLLVFTKRHVLRWTHWIGQQSLLVRGLFALLGAVLLGGLALLGAYSMGWWPFN
jgi:uncharacterized protein (TIGR02611 family)